MKNDGPLSAARHGNYRRSAEGNRRVSEAVKQSWADPVRRAKRMASLRRSLGRAEPAAVAKPHTVIDQFLRRRIEP